MVVTTGWFIDFLLGAPGNRKLKDALATFYVSLEEGDWTVLYRYPASALLQFMVHVVGSRPFSPLYFVRTAIVSAIATLTLFVASMTWTYIYSTVTETHCLVPPLRQFVEIPVYMSNFIVWVILINIVVDYFSWSITQVGLKQLAMSRGRRPVIFVLVSPLAIFCMLYLIYCIYLPLAIIVQVGDRIRVNGETFFRLIRGNLINILGFFSRPRSLFVLDCPTTDHTFFSISYFNTMQILAVETVIPFALLFIFCVLGIVAYLTKPVTKKPLSFLVQRMDSSGQRVTVLLVGALAVLSALFAAIVKFQGG
jgi:hypothetical protein